MAEVGPFLRACRGEPAASTPVWLMRQAGRILPPYRELREKVGSIESLFTTPELAAQVTLMPVELLGVDAAILFTDLVTPLAPMGCPFEYRPGPVFARPVRTRQEVLELRPINTEADLPFVVETVQLVRRALPAGIPLIGYAGAPFTLATWAVEGKGAKDFSAFRAMLYQDPGTAHLLLDRLTEVAIEFLRAQIRAGAEAVQVFDTSVGVLSAAGFARFGLPYLQRVFAALADAKVPRIYFPLAGSHLLALAGQTGADVLSLDWRVDLAEAFRAFPGIPLQGNLDPCALLAPVDELLIQARTVLEAARGQAHVFNLGHGVLPETPLDNVRRLVDAVHEFGTQHPR
ncbi:MAG: uroporphyrinogen decarboxylase [Candidatus Latescibacterota bacterium]|jgi:uroporphyrinogen decarboxylase